MRDTSRRRLLVVLLALTVLVLGVDVAGGPGAGAAAVRRRRGVRAARAAAVARCRPRRRPTSAARDGAACATSSSRRRRDGTSSFSALTGRRPTCPGASFVPARVVGVGREGAAGPERVTLDVGARDGVRADLSVVNADGLVGRVVAVSPWTCDVLLVGSADLVVGVRVGAAGTLGSVGSGARGRAAPPGRASSTSPSSNAGRRAGRRRGDHPGQRRWVAVPGRAAGRHGAGGRRRCPVTSPRPRPSGRRSTSTTLGVVGVLARTGPRATPRARRHGDGAEPCRCPA